MRSKATTLLALTLMTFFAAGCGSSGGNFNLISIEDEWTLGQQLQQEVATQVRLLNDPAANAYVTSLGQRLVAQTPAPFNSLPWTFHVVDDPSVNAFAIPGGHVYVNRGLIEAAHNASELAGVMAHEISHVTSRHSTEQMSRQYGAQILAGLVLGQNPGQLSQIAAGVIAGGVFARYSRAAEAEADEKGVALMSAAGYDPHGMVTMFETLLALEKTQPSRVEQFFADHPTTSSRIDDVQKQIAKLPQRTGYITDEPEFQSVRSRLA